MEFQVSDMRIQVIRTAGEDYAIEFVAEIRSGEVSRFAIVWDNEVADWAEVRIVMDPQSAAVPVGAMLWAMDYARNEMQE